MHEPFAVSARNVEANGLNLALVEAGAGGRPLLAVHGFTGAKEDFADSLAPLAERGWHAVSVDLRGHGSSDAPTDEAAYSFEILAGDLAALVGALGWTSCTLVGHSMGGILAQMVALQRPELVDALVLLDSFCGPVRGIEMELIELGVAIVRQTGMTGLAQALAARREEDPHPLLASHDTESLPAGHAEYSEAKLLATSPDLWVAMAPIFLTTTEWLESLHRIEVPTAVLVGEHDRASLDDSRRIAEAIPRATLSVIDGAGHSPQFEAPDGYWRSLTAFLDRLDHPQTPN